MKPIKISLIALAIIIIAACNSSKKTTATTTISTTTTSTNTNTTTDNFVLVKPANGIYPPGNEELVAIQAKYKEVTIDQLKQGHAIYAEGACIKCHGAKNIYRIEEAKWSGILDNMALKARITDAQKDAVYKYVLSIKAAQANKGK